MDASANAGIEREPAMGGRSGAPIGRPTTGHETAMRDQQITATKAMRAPRGF
ncbi:MAG: hypothetical protein U1E03_04470 [Hyphomonadaceae bacterium]